MMFYRMTAKAALKSVDSVHMTVAVYIAPIPL